MGTAPKLNATLIDFIKAQPVFFVATAAPDGRVNVSPKGLNSLRVLSERKIIWLNLSGSGNETAAHVWKNPRMTLMFCAFEGDALIVRTYGQAKAFHPADAEWEALCEVFPKMAGSRQIFSLEIDLVQTTCGSGVSHMQFLGERGPQEMLPFFEELGEEGVKAYWARKNRLSLDGFETGT